MAHGLTASVLSPAVLRLIVTAELKFYFHPSTHPRGGGIARAARGASISAADQPGTSRNSFLSFLPRRLLKYGNSRGWKLLGMGRLVGEEDELLSGKKIGDDR